MEQRLEPSSVAFELNIQATSGFPALVPSVALERQLDFRLLASSEGSSSDADGKGRPGSHFKDQKVAIHIHSFYVEELALILEALERCADALSGRSALFLTTDTEEKRRKILGLLGKSSLGQKITVKRVQLVENRGRNIRPLFLDIYPLISRYDIAVHMHTKRSVGNRFGREWLLDLLNSLIPSESFVKMILSTFRDHPKLGMIMPQAGDLIRPLSNWGSNFVLARMLCSNVFPDRVLDPQAPLIFPAGMMFWFRPAALQPMADVCRRLVPFVSEPVAEDGTLLHALERLSAHFCEAAGYRWALSTNDPDLASEVGASKMLADLSVWAKNEDAYLHATRQLAEELRYMKQTVDELRRTCDLHAASMQGLKADAARIHHELDLALSHLGLDVPSLEPASDQGDPLKSDDHAALSVRIKDLLRYQAELRSSSEALELQSRDDRLRFDSERQKWDQEREQLFFKLRSQEKSADQQRQQFESRLREQEQVRNQERQNFHDKLSSQEQAWNQERQNFHDKLSSQEQAWNQERQNFHDKLSSQEQAWDQERQALFGKISGLEQAAEQQRQQFEAKLQLNDQVWQRERQELCDKISSHQQVASELAARVEQSRSKQAEQDALLDAQQQALSDLHARHGQAEQELSQLRQISHRYDEAQNEICELITLLATRDQQLTLLQQQCDESLRNYQQLDHCLAESRSEITRLADQIQAERLQRSALQTQLQKSFRHRIRSLGRMFARKVVHDHSSVQQEIDKLGDPS